MAEEDTAARGGGAATHQDLQRRAVGGLLWTLSGAGAQAILRLLLVLVLARLLGPEAFGVIGAALVVVTFSQLSCQFGIGSALVQRAELEPRHIHTAFAFTLASAALVAGAVQLLAPAIAAFFGFDGLTAVLRALGLVPLLGNPGIVPDSLMRRALAFRRLAALSVISFALGYGVVGVGLALAGAGVWALVAAHLTEAGARSLMLLIAQPFPKAVALDRAALRELTFYGGGIVAWRVGNALAQGGDNIVVGRWLGAEALGLYGRAYQLTSMPAAVLGRALQAVLFPVMARVQEDRPRLGAAYRRSVAVLALLTLPAAAAVVVLAPELILVLLGPEWDGAIVPLQLLAPGIFFRLSFQISDSMAFAAGAAYASAWRQGLYAAAVVAGAVVGQRWGLPGVAAGVLAALCLHFVLKTELSLRLTSLGAGAFAAAHLRGALLGALVGVELGITATALRGLNAPPAFTLGAAAAVLLATALIVLRVRGGALIGADGLWLLHSLAGRLPRRFAAVPRLLGLRHRPAAAGTST